jgi:large subunit ribosomal protein L25
MNRDITITAEPRDTRGKNEARRLRARGLAPAVVYGAGQDPVAIAINPKEVNKVLHGVGGHNTIFKVHIANGETTPVMVVDWQNDPIREDLLHCDLKRIDMNKRIAVKVRVHTTSEPRGVKEQGGLYEIVLREIEIECLPNEIPAEFTADVRQLMLGESLRASAIPMSGSMKLLTHADAVISHVVALRAAAEEAAPEAEGTAPAAAAGSEPEVIKKGKKEEEEAAADKKKK